MSDIDPPSPIAYHSEQILDMANPNPFTNHFVDINEMVYNPSDHLAHLRKLVKICGYLSTNQGVLS